MAAPPGLTRLAECPPVDTLAQLLAGSLVEEAADQLFDHIDQCAKCQATIDQIEQRADGVIVAARRAAALSGGSRKLSSLIQRAQQLGSTAKRAGNAAEGRADSGRANRVPIEGFIDGLKRSGLFADAEVESFVDEVKARDSKELATQLIERGKLTAFQAKALLRGRWKGFVLGNYVLLEKLGQGGMGSVFKARHRRMNRIVCLKIMNASVRRTPHLIRRFQHEARTVALLSHPNIVVAHDADEANGVPFLVMEYIKGNDLAVYVQAHGPLAPANAVEVTLQVARALEYAHGQGVIHRDIKPHNLLMSRDPETNQPLVKVLDMGLARFDSVFTDNPDASVHAAMTNTGVIMGTVDYMSPEQAVNTRSADQQSDVYSLGCTLYFLLTGRALYDGETMMARLVAHREQPVPSIHTQRADVTPQLDAVFRKMAAKRPAARYASMSALISDLEAIQSGASPIAMADVVTDADAGMHDDADTMAIVPVDDAVTALSLTPIERRQVPMRSRGLAANMSIGVAGIVMAGLAAWAGRDHVFSSLAVSLPDSAGGWPASAAETNAATPVPDPVIVGHPATLKNGGPGRVLIAVPNSPGSHFHEDEFLQVTSQLDSRSIQYATMGAATGKSHAKHGTIADFEPDLKLEEFSTDDFDALVFVGGSVHEFTHKNPSRVEYVRSMLNDAVASGMIVSGIDSAFWVIEDAGICAVCDMQKKGELQIRQPEDQSGYAIRIPGSRNVDEFVRVAFDELLARRAAGEDQPMSGVGNP